MINFFVIFFKQFYLLRFRLFARLFKKSLYKNSKRSINFKRLFLSNFYLKYILGRFLLKFRLRFKHFRYFFDINSRLLFLKYKALLFPYLRYRRYSIFMTEGRRGFLKRHKKRIFNLLPREKTIRRLALSLMAFRYFNFYKFHRIVDSQVGSSFAVAFYSYRKLLSRRKFNSFFSLFPIFFRRKIQRYSSKRRFIFVSNFIGFYSLFSNFFNYANTFNFNFVIKLLKNRFFKKFGYLASVKNFRSFLSRNTNSIFNTLVNYDTRLIIERKNFMEFLQKKVFFINNHLNKFFTSPLFDTYKFYDFFAKPFSFFSFLYLGNKKNLRFSSSRFIDFFLLNRSYTVLISNYSSLDTVNYSISNNFRMHKALSFFFAQNNLFFSPRTDFVIRDGIKVDPVSNRAVFNFDKVNFSKNLFFKVTLLKYKKVILFCSSLSFRLLIELLPNNKLKLKFLFDKFYYNVKKTSSFKFYKYIALKTMYKREILKIYNNNIYSYAFKFSLLNSIKKNFNNNSLLHRSFFKPSFVDYNISKLFHNLKKSDLKNVSNLSFVENTVLRHSVKSVGVNNYYFDYSIIKANLKYFFVSNFHLGFQKNRWDPNFIHYYWGVRRNYMILNLNRTWLNFKFLAYNIWDCVKYRLPVLFVNQNRLIDMFVSKTFHSLSLLNSAIVSSFRWLGGTLSNIKNVCSVQPGFNKSLYKVAINLMSTKYIRSSISLFPVGISLNNIKNYWFINELNNVNVKSHSVVDSNGILIYPENIIAGNTLSLSSNVFFLNVCRLIVDSCLKKERLVFSISKVLEILPNDVSQLLKDNFFVSSLYPVAQKRLRKAFYRMEDRNIYYNYIRSQKFLLYKNIAARFIFFNSKKKIGKALSKKLKYFNFSLKYNQKALNNIRNTSVFSVQSSNFMKGTGTFLSYFRRAQFNEKNRVSLLISRGFAEYIPLNNYENMLLKNVFSIKFKNNYLFDHIDYVLYKYLNAIKNYRKKNLKIKL